MKIAQKRRIQHCERNELRLHFERTKGQFWRELKAFGQIVLPDRSLLIRQKLVENAKIEKSKIRYFVEVSIVFLTISKILPG